MFEEHGYPRELVNDASRSKAVRDGALTEQMLVTVYRDGEEPGVVRAGDIPELRALFEPEAPPEPAAGPASPPAAATAPPEIARPAVKTPDVVFGRAQPGVWPAPSESADRSRLPLHRAVPVPAQAERQVAKPPAARADPASKKMIPAFLPFTRYAEFTGRSGRAEFWSFLLLAFGALVLGIAINNAVGALVLVGTALPMLAVTVRRLHDIKLSGWWILIGLIPTVGIFILLIMLLVPGTGGTNQFGGDPQKP